MTENHSQFNDKVDALELLMLRGEASAKTRSAMLSIALLDEVPNFAALRDTFEYASRQFIRLRQHVVLPALGLGSARWVIDPDFNLDFHLRRISAPSPGQLRDILDIASHILQSPMDTQRPLWEVFLIEGINDGNAKATLIIKMHHAVSDGMGGLLLLKLLFNSSREQITRELLPQPIPEDVNSLTLSRRGLNRALGDALPAINRLIRSGTAHTKDLLQHPTEYIENLRQQFESAQRILSNGDCHPSPLLMRRSLDRQLDVLEYPLDDLKHCAKHFNASVNDIYIAAIAGGLQRYHNALDCEHEALPLAMPVSLRRANNANGGNHFAAARINLPLTECDPKRRIAQIQHQVSSAIAEPAINIMNHIAPLLVHLPTIALNELGDLASHLDVQASNVPGLRETAYIGGSKILKLYPFGPLPGIPLMLVMMSHDGACYLGSHCDTAAVANPELLMRCLNDEFNELIDASKTPTRRAKTPRKSTVKAATQRKAVARTKATKLDTATVKGTQA